MGAFHSSRRRPQCEIEGFVHSPPSCCRNCTDEIVYESELEVRAGSPLSLPDPLDLTGPNYNVPERGGSPSTAPPHPLPLLVPVASVLGFSMGDQG